MTDEFTVTVRREIAAPADDLFDAWLDAQSLGTWLRPSGVRETRAETDPRIGGTFRIVMVDDETSMEHTGTYREIDRPRRLVFTWSSPATQFRDSIVTVTFEPSSDGSTVIEINQVGLPDEEARAGHDAGWSDALRELERIVGSSDRRIEQ
ncbi:MAG TPA: SRPBCC domain-containing protein [Acidimicrobiia bacterium]